MEDGKATVGYTPSGKELQLVRKRASQYMVFQFSDGGEIPKQISGVWNNYNLALAAGDAYLKDLAAKAKAKEKAEKS